MMMFFTNWFEEKYPSYTFNFALTFNYIFTGSLLQGTSRRFKNIDLSDKNIIPVYLDRFDYLTIPWKMFIHIETMSFLSVSENFLFIVFSI